MILLTLSEQEQIIEEHKEGFVLAGRALVQIRSNWDHYKAHTPYEKFSEYCKERWSELNLPPSTFYNKLDVIEVNALLPEPIPIASHASTLHRYLGNDSQLINAAWQEVSATTDKPTAKYVETIAKKHWLMEHGEKLGELVQFGQITPDKAYGLCLVLEKLPPYYIDAVYNFGIGAEDCILPDALMAIRALENFNQDAAMDILRSGFLNDTPLWQLTARDVNTYMKRLSYETTEQRKLDASDKQKSDMPKGVKILDGLDVWDIQGASMYYLFPNGSITPKEVLKILEKNNLSVYYVCVYDTENPPNINFDGKPVKPNDIIVKPKRQIDYMKNSIL